MDSEKKINEFDISKKEALMLLFLLFNISIENTSPKLS